MKRKLKTTAYSLIFFLLYIIPVYASGEPKIISGTKRLLTDVGTWLTGLAAVATIAVALFHGLKWQAAGKDEKSLEAKAVKNTIVIGVIITCLSGIVTLVFGYYN